MFPKLKIFIVTVLATLVLVACSGGAPDIQLESGEADLGELINGEVKTLEVTVRNAGTGDLIIEAVTTSCGCTSASVEPSTIRPGGEGILHIEYDSGAHGPEANGPVMRQIFIASNDPDQPEIEFRLTADVFPPES
ncbi:MAG: DUF1573 domain-containing protein [Anaerolineales bacterium]|nr:DUF1573 domain-containing protein [Anaerolineales bacterium]